MEPVTPQSAPPSAVGGGTIGVRAPAGAGGGLGMISRLALGLATGAATAGLATLLAASPLTSRLDPWAVITLANGILFGPAGIVGSAIAHLMATLTQVSDSSVAFISTGAYVLLGAIAYGIFRHVPSLNRGLANLRSYLGFLTATVVGSLVVAGIGSANLFLRTMGIDAFWTGVVYWFSSAVTSLLIVAPFFLVVAAWKLRPWLIVMPGEEVSVGAAEAGPAVSEPVEGSQSRRDIALGTAMVLGTTALISPLVHLRPQNGEWFTLLYLVPILWGSINRGLSGGVLAASGSGVAYLLGSAVSSTLLSREVSHDEIVGQFVGLVILSLVGAITGAFQQARLGAESALLQSKLELEKRNESLALVNHLADRLKRTLDVETITREAVEALEQLSRPPMVAVYILDESGSKLQLAAHRGFSEPILATGRTLPVKGSLSGLTLGKREIVVVEDLKTDERIEPSTKLLLVRAGFETVISIPLVFERQALGVINLIYRDRQEPAAEDLEGFSTIGRTVALALVNARNVSRLEFLAFNDVLTGLPNREGLHRWFSGCVQPTSGDFGRLGLALLDIDRFKEVNDALGHHVGDQLLAQIGPRVQSILPDRTLSVFRLAGDEFAVFLPNLEDNEESAALTRNLLAALAEPFQVSGIALEVEASAGIAIYPDDARSSSELLRCADVAVNHAKRTSRRIVRYDPSLDQHTPERLALASELGRAIRDDQLVLHFQPKVTLADGQPIGFEALVRWQHPTQGLLPPDTFIPLAEVGELIHPLTYWVVEHALEQLEIWQRREPGLTMAVNLSTRNLLDRSCASRLERLMAEAHVDPKTIEFELTETALLIDPETATATLTRISDSGARVVIDDFGTGYSSMAFLKRCPIHALKIDRSFVGDMLSDTQSHAIVRATVLLAHDLGLAVVAEGVEDSGTVDALSEMGCTVGQGYFFQRPCAADELELSLPG